MAGDETRHVRQSEGKRYSNRSCRIWSCCFALAILGVVGAQSVTIPPDVLMVNHKACNVSNIDGRWLAVGTASYLEDENYHHEPWTVNFPFRKTIEASEKDCNKWFKDIAKIQAAAKPVNVKDLKKEK